MSQSTRTEVLEKLRRRYQTAGAEHKRQLIDQAVALLGYHRKSAIRALGQPAVARGSRILTGRPIEYKSSLLVPWLRPIWQATDYACGRRLVAMLPEWIRAYEQHERRMPGEVREKLLLASGRTLDRLLEPLRAQGTGRSLTRPGTLLRQQIPIRGSVWEEDKAGWLEVDTVALCGGSVAGEFVWMVDAVDYATTWVELRAMWGRGQVGTLAALQDLEVGLPFALLGLDSDNGGEFLNYHCTRYLPSFMPLTVRPPNFTSKTISGRGISHGLPRRSHLSVTFRLPPILQGLGGDAELIVDPIAQAGDTQRGQGIKKTRCQSPQTTVAQTRLFFLLEQDVQVPIKLFQSCLHLLTDPQIH